MANPLAKYLLFLLIVGVSAIHPAGSIANAEEKSNSAGEQKQEKRKTKKAMIIRQKVSKKLESAQKLTEAKQYQDALAVLNDILESKNSDYEIALTHNMKAYVYFSTENYEKAKNAYIEILKLKKIPDPLRQTAQLSLTKAYMVKEEYKAALKSINAWFALVDDPEPEQYVLRAQLKFQLQDYKGALPDVKHAIDQVKKEGKTPKENWLLVERAVYFQNNDFKKLERCLEDLIIYYPKQQYWTQLSYVYSELGKQNKSLVALETAYEQNLLEKEAQIISLAQYMLSEETPYKAAKVILKGMKAGKVEETGKNLSLLGDALMMAKEYSQAISVLTEAAAKTKDNKDFYKLAQIHAERQEWQQANVNVEKALTNKQFKYYDDALVLKGLVLFNLNQLDDAKQVFVEINRADPEDRSAQQWLAYIDSEQKRREYMAQ